MRFLALLLIVGACRSSSSSDSEALAPRPATVAPPAAAAPAPSPASWSGLQALAAGAPVPIDGPAGVIDVAGASADPSGATAPTAREVRPRCGDDAAAEVRAMARRIVERERASGEQGAGVSCDLHFLDVPDPAFGGRRYAVCTSGGVAEYDSDYAIYFVPYRGSLAVVGIVTTETGSAKVDDDVRALSTALAAQVVRCGTRG